MKRQAAIVLAFGFALALPAAFAQAPFAQGGHMGRMGHGGGPFQLMEFDTNADGKLSKSELDAALKSRFAELDADRNGSATHEEFRAHAEARREEARKARFAALDTDKNGQLSQSEMEAGEPEGERRRGGPGPRAMNGKRGPGAHADTNGDSSIDFAEFSRRPLDAFTVIDANKDGTVTVAEMQAASRPGRP